MYTHPPPPVVSVHHLFNPLRITLHPAPSRTLSLPRVQPAAGQHKWSLQVGVRASSDGDPASSNTPGTPTPSGVNNTRSQGGPGATGGSRRVQLPPPCDLSGAEPQSRWNPVSLAYLGDAVWEAHLRSYLYSHGSGARLSSQQQYNSRVAAKANTHAQATCYQLLLSEGWPTAEEAALLRWAANSSSVTPPKHATRQQYKQATALEALVAYLYLKDSQRLEQLMEWLLAPDRVCVWRSDVAAGRQQPTKQAAHQGRRRRGHATS